MPSPPKLVAVLDANVLYPPLLRDVLLSLAVAELYQALWSDEILVEVERNLGKHLGPEKAHQQIRKLRAVLPAACVPDHPEDIGKLGNDPKDRHVVATAVRGQATVIVTSNVKDFVPLPPDMTAMLPDDFLCTFLQHDAVCRACLEEVRCGWPEPPDMSYLLTRLSTFAPNFARQLRSTPQ